MHRPLSAPARAAPPHKIAREHSRKPCCADALRAGRWSSGQGAAAGCAEVQVRLWQQQSDSVKKKMSRSAPLLPLNSPWLTELAEALAAGEQMHV